MNITDFRTEFPEFANTTNYPNAQITFWATLAEKQVPQDVWGDVWQYGVKLYVAHEITLAYQNVKISSMGGMPGTSGGVPNNKSVGQASVSYDSVVTSEKNAGYWNLTNYGKQFMNLVSIFGIGAIQL